MIRNQRERQSRFLNDPKFPVSMVCDQLNLLQFFCVGSIDQRRTFAVCDLAVQMQCVVVAGEIDTLLA